MESYIYHVAPLGVGSERYTVTNAVAPGLLTVSLKVISPKGIPSGLLVESEIVSGSIELCDMSR